MTRTRAVFSQLFSLLPAQVALARRGIRRRRDFLLLDSAIAVLVFHLALRIQRISAPLSPRQVVKKSIRSCMGGGRGARGEGSVPRQYTWAGPLTPAPLPRP